MVENMETKSEIKVPESGFKFVESKIVEKTIAEGRKQWENLHALSESRVSSE